MTTREEKYADRCEHHGEGGVLLEWTEPPGRRDRTLTQGHAVNSQKQRDRAVVGMERFDREVADHAAGKPPTTSLGREIAALVELGHTLETSPAPAARILDVAEQSFRAIRILAAAIGGTVAPFVHHDTLEILRPEDCPYPDALLADAMKEFFEFPPTDVYARVGELLGLERVEVKRRVFANAHPCFTQVEAESLRDDVRADDSAQPERRA